MKRLALVLFSGSILLLLVACGGSSGSSGTGGEVSSGSTDTETAWAAEIEAVMTEGEEGVQGAEKRIDSASTRAGLEAAYRSYAVALQQVVSGFRATKAPSSCSSLKSHLVGFLGEFASITADLGRQRGVGEKRFEALVKQDSEAGQVFSTTMERIGSQGHC